MNQNLATYQTLESPRKTGGLIFGVSLLVIGGAFLTLYLVRKSRKLDEDEISQLTGGEAVPVYQPEATTIGGLLTELQGIGGAVFGSDNAAPDDMPADYGCGGSFNKVDDVDEVPSGITKSNMNVKLNVNLNKCGRSVYEFQTYLKNDWGINIPLDGKYGQQTKTAHKEWLIKTKEV